MTPDDAPTDPRPIEPAQDTAVSENRMGSYRLERRLGVGGMGEVYLAQDLHLNRPAAIKLIRHDFAGIPGALERLKVEAQAAARLQHPNIVAVYQFGIEGDRAFIALEYVNGRDLSKVVSQEGLMAPERALRIIRQAATALRYAAENNVLHRDIKPSNILLLDGDVVKVADFGLAKMLDSDSSLTRTDMIIGSPSYMSPEQGLGQPLDFRTDIYSLGCTLYALLMGESPYSASTPLAVMVHHASSPIPEPEQLKAPYKGRLMVLLRKMLAKRSLERHATYDQLIADIDALLGFSPKKPFALDVLTVALYGVLPAGLLLGVGFGVTKLYERGIVPEPIAAPVAMPTPTPVVVAALPSPTPVSSAAALPTTPTPAPTPASEPTATSTPAPTPSLVPAPAAAPSTAEAAADVLLRDIIRIDELAGHIWHRRWDQASLLADFLELSDDVEDDQTVTVTKLVDAIEAAWNAEELAWEYAGDDAPFEIALSTGPARVVSVREDAFTLESPPGSPRKTGKWAQLDRASQYRIAEYALEDSFGYRIEDALGRATYLHLLDPSTGDRHFDEMRHLEDFADREGDLLKRWALWKVMVWRGQKAP